MAAAISGAALCLAALVFAADDPDNVGDYVAVVVMATGGVAGLANAWLLRRRDPGR